jgi:hypothetical protein
MCKPLILPFLAAALATAQGPIMQNLGPRYQQAKLNMIESAELMPEDAYSYKLTPAQRSFGGWVEHNVGMCFTMCSLALGKPAPEFRKGLTAKADLVAELKKAFEVCDEAFQLTDEQAMKTVTVNGKPSVPANTLINTVINWNEHYGNMVGYLRTKGLTPPSTARAMKKK